MFFRTHTIAFSCLVATLASATAFATTELELKLEAFHRDPKAAMEALPTKKDSNGRVIQAGSQSKFSAEDIRNKSFVEKKDSFRNGKAALEGRAGSSEQLELFLDMNEFQARGLTPISNLEQMDKAKLKEAKLKETPWSDTYWPISQGMLGARYSNYKYTRLGHNWKAHHDLLSKPEQSVASIVRGGNQDEIDALSPSEKYDLLIGDLSGRSYSAGYLTPSQWEQGAEYFKDQGKVEEWMGICNGWASAAFMVERPTSAITVKAADGKTDLKFFPSDMKGLASYAWAYANVQSNFYGGRCNAKNPKKDPTTGRNLDKDCFDTNPGDWHKAIVNQIGLAKRSFVIDATYDYEVWNQPVYSYKYRYFNPQTGREVSTLQEATVKIADFTNDKFKKFRAKNAKFVVGIEMDMTYVVETEATHDETDSAANDATTSASYIYDVELDSRGNIIGGEWYSNAHPDFLWLPPYDSHAAAAGESRLPGTWKVGEPLPKMWKDIAIRAATNNHQPLISIIEPLIKASNKKTR